jgi:hypothetical protein
MFAILSPITLLERKAKYCTKFLEGREEESSVWEQQALRLIQFMGKTLTKELS